MSKYPSYLIHYGILGQKWGNRRYQNEDGSYTPEGKIRRKDERRSPFSMLKSKNGTHPKFSNRRKTIRNLSDNEIRRRNERLELENKYRRNLNDFNYTNSPSASALNAPPRREALSIVARAAAIPATAIATAGVAVFLKDHPEFLKIILKNKGG